MYKIIDNNSSKILIKFNCKGMRMLKFPLDLIMIIILRY